MNIKIGDKTYTVVGFKLLVKKSADTLIVNTLDLEATEELVAEAQKAYPFEETE